MEMLRRFDVGRMDAAEVTPAGFLKARAYATRTGVFHYRTADGKVRREARLPEEVFNADSLRSLSGVPLTDDHPAESMVTSKTARVHQRGYTGDDVRADGEYVATPVTVTDQELIDKIGQGKSEVSCGYECYHDEKPGIYNGQPYDVIQRGIRYNHLAVVEKGRAGPMARLRLDSADAEMVENPPKKENEKMENITINGTQFQVPKEVAQYIAELEAEDPDGEEVVADAQKKADAAEARAKKAEEDLAASTAEKDKQLARADSLAADLEKAKVNTDEAIINARVKERTKVLSVAAALLPKEKLEKIDSLSDLDIKKEVILAQSPKATLADKSEVYVGARYDSIVEHHEAAGKNFTTVGEALVKQRADSISDAAAKRKASIEKSHELYKAPLAANAEEKK